ncbi:hypothetical protein ACM66B_000365 [Microbotryomycetes sp. NB124-2]
MTTETYAVKRYECLFTTQIRQKHKTWQDGYLRFHHYNAKAFLIRSDDGAVLAETFVHAPRNARGQKSRFDDAFELEGEIDVDNKFLVQIGDVVWTGSTNVADVSKATREAKVKAQANARAWAASEDKTSTAPLANMSNNVGSSTAPSVQAQKPYQGFGISAPKSYTGGKQPLQARGCATSSNSINPYARSPQVASKDTSKTAKQPEPAVAPPSAAEVRKANNMLGPPSKASVAEFKPPRPAALKRET